MNLTSYRRDKGLSQAAFAALLTEHGSPATQGLVSQWESGAVNVPAERCEAIRRATDGLVTGHDLRPDVFGPAPTGQAA